VVEFLGAGTDQRCCAMRAAEDKTRVRLVGRDAVQRLLAKRIDIPVVKEPTPPPSKPTTPQPKKNISEVKVNEGGEEVEDDGYSTGESEAPPPTPPPPQQHMFPTEKAYFEELMLDRIDSLPHKGAKAILQWNMLGEPTLEYMRIPGQTFFFVNDSLGMTQSGPLPEGVEDRYFLDGQVVLKRGIPADSAILILRGELEAEVPEGCEGNCLHSTEVLAKAEIDLTKEITWLADGRPEPVPPPPPPPPEPEILVVEEPVKQYGKRKKKIEKPKTPPPVIEEKIITPPRAVIGPGQILGRLALLGDTVVLPGTLRARGPCVIAILHRHALMECLIAAGAEELKFFDPKGFTDDQVSAILKAPCTTRNQGNRPDHLGPATGPPKHKGALGDWPTKDGLPPASTMSAWRSEDGLYSQLAGADALQMVLLNALHESTLMHKILDDAPPRLVDAFMKAFEPRWLLPNEIVVVDEEPDADFLIVVIHGTFLVTLEGCQIDLVRQGSMLGEAQLLGLNDWTRTVLVHPENEGEAKIMVLRRDKMVEVLSKHPVPKLRIKQVEQELGDAKDADWRVLARVPTFLSIATKPFLSRLHKDADILFFCPGDHIAKAEEAAASLIVILAGTCRCEQPMTLFCLELKRGDWCFQNNILGNDATRQHDVVAITSVMVMILHRHALLNAVTSHPSTRRVVLENERWRADIPQISNLRCFERVPTAVIMQMEDLASPCYYKQDSILFSPGEEVPDDCLLLILRGTVTISIFGMEIRRLTVGDTIGLMKYLKLPTMATNTTITAATPVDLMRVHQSPMDEAEENEMYEDELIRWFTAKRTLQGGAILDQYGFETGYGGRLRDRCIEESDMLSVCSPGFVSQIPKLVEDRIYYPGEKLCVAGGPPDCMFFIQAGRVRMQMLGVPDEFVEAGGTVGEQACIGLVNDQPSTAIAETHLWVRVLYKSLLQRALVAFDGEERRLTGARDGGHGGVFDD
jgi:CRP-like cAMP-binding protein